MHNSYYELHNNMTKADISMNMKMFSSTSYMLVFTQV